MVTLNLTLLVQALLFLGFLWLLNRVVFRPLLRTMDAREEQLQADAAQAADAAAQAEQLEQEYRSKSLRMHREASARLMEVHRQAQQEHLARVAELRAQEEAEVKVVRKDLRAQIKAQEGEYDALAATLIKSAGERLGLRGNRG